MSYPPPFYLLYSIGSCLIGPFPECNVGYNRELTMVCIIKASDAILNLDI